MKKIFTLTIALIGVCAINAQTNIFPATGAAGIGTTSPDPSSVLEVVSTSKGILIPRMTKNQRDAIAIPSTGLLIFQTNSTPGFYYYSGSAWVAVSTKGVSKTLNNLTPTAVNQSLVPGVNDSINLGSPSLMWRNAYLTDTAFIGGSVGIGTITPAAKLDVNGDALINGITVGMGGGNVIGNTASGLQALYVNNTGFWNTANGNASLFNNASGSGNTANGFEALYYNTTGLGNSASGGKALHSNTEGGYNTALGYSADVSTGTLNNAMAVGAHAIVNASNKVRIGDGFVNVVESAAGSWVTSDGRFKNNIKEDVKGLEFIKLLRPVTYNFDTKKFEEFLMQNYPDSIKAKRMQNMKQSFERSSAMRQTGFVAQEVFEAATKSGYDFNGVHAPENPTDNWSLSYEKLVVPLVKAVQELSKMNDEKDTKINELETRLSKLEAMMNAKGSAMSDELPVNNAKLSSVNGQQSSAALQQNIPNPFNQTTSINYTLPQQFTAAKIRVTNKMGAVVKEIDVSGAGKGNLKIDASTLASGAYSYSLYVDGKLVATKQMEHIK